MKLKLLVSINLLQWCSYVCFFFLHPFEKKFSPYILGFRRRAAFPELKQLQDQAAITSKHNLELQMELVRCRQEHLEALRESDDRLHAMQRALDKATDEAAERALHNSKLDHDIR